ncbi:MAG: hypothetical protein CMJ24_00765, partial [Phycisphaerae bacterium]|nr:hypothetical protein [Phycisphaerae bacterium]
TITGACCLYNGNCADETLQIECDTFGGTWNEGQTCSEVDCPQPGACCFGNGACSLSLETDCLDAGGDFLGEGTDCDPNQCPQPTGACCYDDGSCNENLEQTECLGGGGSWNEALTCQEADCPQPAPYAACCVDFNCTLQTEADCLNNNGEWYAGVESCSPNPCTVITVDDDGLDLPDADFDSIQAAVDFAGAGWEIVVYPGTYTATGDCVMNLDGKELHLHGLPGQAEQTIVDGENQRRCAKIADVAPGMLHIAHLTLTRGGGTSSGGSAIRANDASPLIESVIVTGNASIQRGTVYGFGDSDMIFRSCVFEANESSTGAGIGAYDNGVGDSCEITVESCEFRNNLALLQGGALYTNGSSSFTVSDTLFCENRCTACDEPGGNPDDQDISGNWTDGGGNEFLNFCSEINVDDDGLDWPDAQFSNIQDAVDAAADGDTILVHPGTYTTSGGSSTPVVNLDGKRVTLVSNDGPEVTFIDGRNGSGYRTHVGIRCDDAPAETRIEGFTIIGCKAESTERSGGGMRLTNSSPTVIDCIIRECEAGLQGGGVYARDSEPTFRNVRFIDNEATLGGGIYFFRSSASSISPVLQDCLFEGNDASSGGAIFSNKANLLVTGSVIRSNTANTAGAIYIGDDPAWARIRNSVLCGNSLPQLGGHEPAENFNNEISDDCVTGACCLDDGICSDDAAFDAMYGLTCELLGGEFTIDATCEDDPCSEACPADINGDGIVNVQDLLNVIADWGCTAPESCLADINGDGTVNVQDLLLVIGDWNCQG